MLKIGSGNKTPIRKTFPYPGTEISLSLLQDSLDQTEGKVTPALQVSTSQVCQETEEVPVSQVPQDQQEPQDLLEGLDEMACLDRSVKFIFISNKS